MQSTTSQSKRLLIVEDNEDLRLAFAALLEAFGYEARQAGDGKTALQMASEESPDLIILDLGLPDINGIEITRRLKANEQTRDIAVLALTGNVRASDECLAAGCADVLLKPVTTAVLLKEIARQLGQEAPNLS